MARSTPRPWAKPARISLHHVHTDEDLTITYKQNGQYDEEALKKINWIMRDWRKNEPTEMDPQEIDLLWEVYQEVGAKEPIEIICGYRSPDTNNMLRGRSKAGVARNSQHTLGKAIDFYIPGVPLDKLRATAMRRRAAASATIRPRARRSCISTSATCAPGRA